MGPLPTPHPSPSPRAANYYSIILVYFVLDLALALPAEEFLGSFDAVNKIVQHPPPKKNEAFLVV